MAGGECVAECQRKKHSELRAALRLGIKYAGEKHWLRRRLGPADRLAEADQLGKIERLGRYCDRGFHVSLSAVISRGLVELYEPRGCVAFDRLIRLSRRHDQRRKEYDPSEPFPIPGQR